jgi:hypothetical protein
MHVAYKNIIKKFLNNVKENQEEQNIWENELPDDSIERTFKSP